MASTVKPQEEMSTADVVKLIEAEEDTGEDIIEELSEEDIKQIYNDLSAEDKKRFRQFRRFHRQYFGVYGEHVPSYYMARQVITDLMPGLPAASADMIAAKRAQILAEDRLRELCRLHGYKFPEKEMRMEAPRQEEEAEPSYRFPSIQDEYRMGLATATREEIQELVGEPFMETEPAPEETPQVSKAPRRVVPTVIKTEPGKDVKPKRLRTEILGQKSLLRWEGTGDEEVIITTVQKGNDPLGRYFEDTAASQQIIEVEESDSEDDLSVASLQSEGDVNREELKGVLQGLAESHQQTATHLGTLSTMVTGMSEDTVGDVASRVASDMGAIKGWHHILDSFDRAQIALVLAVGVRHVEEFEILKGLRPKDDVTPFLRLAKIFGSNTRTIQECYAGMKYRYSEKARGPETGPPRKLQPPEVEGTSESTTESTGKSSVTATTKTDAESSV